MCKLIRLIFLSHILQGCRRLFDSCPLWKTAISEWPWGNRRRVYAVVASGLAYLCNGRRKMQLPGDKGPCSRWICTNDDCQCSPDIRVGIELNGKIVVECNHPTMSDREEKRNPTGIAVAREWRMDLASTMGAGVARTPVIGRSSRQMLLYCRWGCNIEPAIINPLCRCHIATYLGRT